MIRYPFDGASMPVTNGCGCGVSTHYSMTQSLNHWRKGMLGNFPNPSDPHSHGSWDKSKNLYPSRNSIFPNLTTGRAPGLTQPAACGSRTLTVASLGIMWYLNGYCFLPYCLLIELWQLMYNLKYFDVWNEATIAFRQILTDSCWLSDSLRSSWILW